MLHIAKFLSGSKNKKPSFGQAGGMNYAVNIMSLDDNAFYVQSFGRQLDDLKKVKIFKETAKKGYVASKHKATMSSVKQWVKDNHPSEFYAQWKPDSQFYKDDVVTIWYK